MSAPAKLFALECVSCHYALTAGEQEVAWTCPQCGKGTQLTGDGLAAVTVNWCLARPGAPSARWLPFWVFSGRVVFGRRETFSGNEPPNTLWGAAVRFYIPAFSTSVDMLEALGAALTRKQPAFLAGPAAGQLADCSLLPEDAVTAAEFVVLTIEAERRDMLRRIEFQIHNKTAPELWVLPFAGEPALETLLI